MTKTNTSKFKWDNFLMNIDYQRVIPVIGKQLYQVDIESVSNNYSLYKYLAEALASEFKIKIPKAEKYKFQNVCEQFQKKEEYLVLTDFLKKQFQKMSMIPESSLWKLARIKKFDLFMTTAYDDSLLQTLKRVRRSYTDALFYTWKEIKYRSGADGQEFAKIPNSNSNLVFHMFGNFDSTAPAYTKEDIIASIKSFRDKFERRGDDFINLIQRMVGRQLLFLGFEYDDWLFKYLICIMSSIALDKKEPIFKLLIGSDFKKNPKDPFHQLLLFMEEQNAVNFYPNEKGNFIDSVLKEIEKKHPENIIQPEDFPGIAFISFEGKDRSSARNLASKLRQDRIDVWLDEDRLGGGNKVKETIIKAIKRCPVFIPLTSKNTIEIVDKNGELKYHIMEWEYAHTRYLNDEKSIKIIPVVLDDPINLFKEFKNLSCFTIPNGTDGDYEKLKKELEDIQRKYRD